MMEICDSERWQNEKQSENNAVKLVNCLKKRGLHVATAESCTGGMIASGIVDVPGASYVFEEGYVTYSNRIKEKLLGVSHETLERFTAVSEETANEMAAGMAEAAGVELSIAVTGYAGPENGEDGTPAGTVYIGTSFLGEVKTKKFQFRGDRQQVRRQAAEAAYWLGLERIGQSE